jgi:uncharacterized protein (TIGR02594 family)
MVQVVVALRRSLRFAALALCSMAVFVIASPASARSHHGAGRHARAYHAGHRGRHHHYHHHRHYRHISRASRWERGMAQMHARGFAGTQASVESNATPAATAAPGSFGSSNIVAEARRFIGGNPTGMGRLWCARFMNLVLQHSGYRGTGSDAARSFASYGHRVPGPQVGAIAVMARRGGGHVGVVSGIDASGNPIVVSGNNGNRVREAPISRGRIYAYVMPTG